MHVVARSAARLLAGALVLGHPSVGSAQRTSPDTAVVRRELQARYDEMGRAIGARDVARVMRLFADTGAVAEIDRRGWEARFAEMRSLDRFEIAFDALALRGDTARVSYREHNVMTTADSAGTHRREAFVHEVAWWVRGPDGWKHVAVARDGLLRRIVDGVELPPRHADSLAVERARAELARRAWPGERVALAGPDTAHFHSLYERIAERAAREPGIFAPQRLTPEQRATVAWMAGRWACTARVFATPTTPARAGRRVEHSTFRIDGGGIVYETGIDTTATDTIAYALPHLFYDRRAARWVAPVVETAGWGTMTAPAWTGTRIELAGVVSILGSPTDLRQTWTQTSDSTYAIYNEEVTPDGSRVPLDEYACVREHDAVAIPASAKTAYVPRTARDSAVERAGRAITEDALWPVVRALAADSMLGRRPGTRGDTMTVRYLEARFREAGLAPGGTYGYRQPVSLTRMRAHGTLAVRAGGAVSAVPDAEFLARSARGGRSSLGGAPVVFVGHGIVAPEFGWDDYRGVDVRGAVVVMLDGEPAALSARSSGGPGSSTYHAIGNGQTRQAAAHGAAAALVRRGAGYVNGPNNYRWWWEGDYLTAAADPRAAPAITVRATDALLTRLAVASGTTLAAWRAAADRADFRPERLPVTLDATVDAQATPFTSHNVVGVVRGSDPALRAECVVYSTHWDGFGVGRPRARPDGTMDSVYNAASDNAGGIAEMLAAARAAAALRPAPRRTLVFVASTAEEGGLMGAHAYAANPVCPVSRTALVIGMDVFNAYGETGAVGDDGQGYTTVDSTVARLAAERGLRVLRPSSGGNYYAGSDQHALALRGVPAVFASEGGVPEGMTQAAVDSLAAAHANHTPFDEIDPAWRLAGAVTEARFLLSLGIAVADADGRPRWTVDSEFRRAAERGGRR